MSRKRYPLRVARSAHGIRAQDLRTLVRTAWWARRWIAALEAMRLGPRLGRGRQYAVSGQVTDLVLEGPHVEASVTGSRVEPYRVTMDFTAVPGGPQSAVAQVLHGNPMCLARLLTDDLPTEVEEIFQTAGIPLFPRTDPLGRTPEGRPVYDIRMKCSCPDWARPCKHLVAVLLLLGEEVARHPASLLALRGVDVEDLVRPDDPEDDPNRAAVSGVGNRPQANVPPSLDVTADPAPYLKRLGPVPFWRGGARCLDALGRVYSRVRPLAVDAAEGKSIDLR